MTIQECRFDRKKPALFIPILGAKPNLTGFTTLTRREWKIKRDKENLFYTQCRAVVHIGHLYRKGHLHPSEVPKQSNAWQGSRGRRCGWPSLERGERNWNAMFGHNGGVWSDSPPQTSSPTFQRSITCPASPYPTTMSLALTELYPITIETAPPYPARLVLEWSFCTIVAVLPSAPNH